jgi:large conductance mechanosensitive channel
MGVVSRISSLLKEFRTFAIRANAIDLAIAVALGGAFTAVVQAIVAGLFTPLIAAIFGQANFTTLYFTLNGSKFQYGLFVNAAITLLVVAAALFFFVVKPLNTIRRRLGHDTSPPPPMAACPSCFTDIDIRARRCPACTEQLAEGWNL